MKQLLFLTVVLAVLCWPWAPVAAQTPTPPAYSVAHLHTTLGHKSAMDRLDDFYQAQIGKGANEVLQLVGPGKYFNVWQELWMVFRDADGGLNIEVHGTSGFLDDWAKELAKVLRADVPVQIRPSSPELKVERVLTVAEVDLWSALATDDEMSLTEVPSFRHYNLFLPRDYLTNISYWPIKGTGNIEIWAFGSARSTLG